MSLYSSQGPHLRLIGLLLINCSVVLHTATPNQIPLLRSGPGPGLYFDRRTGEGRDTEVGQVLAFGVREAGYSRAQEEQQGEVWGHSLCRQDNRRNDGDICVRKDRKLGFFVVVVFVVTVEHSNEIQHISPARSYAVTQGRASSVPWRKRILLGVVVVVVAALMTISRHVVLLVWGWLLPLPRI